MTATASPGSASLDAPQTHPALGRYVILEHLGQGGMGVVYAAYDPELGRKVAIKVLSAHAHVNQLRLRREAQAMARLQHPNVLAVYDVGMVDDRPFVAMELVEGETLSAWLDREPRSWREVVRMFVQAGRGLAAAHAVALVHRDFKPSNVLVGRDGCAHVGDFGLARAAESDEPSPAPDQPLTERSLSASTSLDQTLTHPGAVLGTPHYMSPEQFLGRTVDARSDQFSFCVALYRGLFRERPFAGEQLADIADAVIHGRTRPRPRDSGVPASVHKAVMRGLSALPAERWPSMEALLAALAHDPEARRRRRLVGTAVGAAALALVVGGTVAAVRHQRSLCVGAEQELAGVWNDGRRQQIRTAFHASGAPFADEAFAEVARALDGFVGAWTAARLDACAATRIRGAQSEELFDLRMECLAEKRAHAQALTDLWTHSDGLAVERAAKLSASLGDVAECNDVPTLRSPVRLPSEPSARAAVDGVRQQIARITALQEAGRYDEALPQAKESVREATQLAHVPTTAAALCLLGMLQTQTGKTREAEATLVSAAAAAIGGRDDVTATRAWTALLRLDGVDLQKFDDADQWGQFAEALVGRLGSDGLLASLWQARSDVELVRGHLAAGLAFAERAVPLQEKRYGAEAVPVADALDVLGKALFRMNRNAESAAVHQRALAIRTKLQGPLHPDLATTLNALAAPLQVLGRYDEELADLRRALAIEERVHGSDSAWVAHALDNIGLALAMQDKLAEAAEYEQRSVAVYDKLGLQTMNASIALANLGERLHNVHRNDEAIAYLQRALALQDRLLGPKHPELGWTLSSIGRLQLDQQHAAEAVATLERALAIWTSDAHINPMNRGQTRFDLAQALWQHGEHARGRVEAAKARGEIASDTPVPETKKEMAEIDTWLSQHR